MTVCRLVSERRTSLPIPPSLAVIFRRLPTRLPNVPPHATGQRPLAWKMSRPTIPSKRPADAQEAAWIADEDQFVLRQAKKKAAIRVKGGRAQTIDWLAVTLAVIDPQKNPLDDELDEVDLDILDPESVFDDLDNGQLLELEKGIDTYLALETSRSNQEYWNVSLPVASARNLLMLTDR